MISWSTIQSLLMFFGPMLLPKAIAFYRSLRAPPNTPPQPVPPETSRALNLLFASGLLWLLATIFPWFTPSNIFTETGARLQTKTALIFNRLPELKPQHETLRHMFVTGGLEARLQYLRFGPDVLCNCPLVDDPKAHDAANGYMVCALPALLKPHLAHLVQLGLATSDLFGGIHAARWRKAAIIAALVLCVADVLSVATYDHALNARATTPAEVDNFFWKRLLVSRLALCATDAVFGYLLWASATLRAFVVPPPPAVQLEAQTRLLESSVAKFRGLAAVQNVVMRDSGFRQKMESYWKREGEAMQEVFEDRDVVDALNGVLERMDVGAVDREAENFVNLVLGPAILPSDGVAA